MEEIKSGLELAKSTYTLVAPVVASETLWNAYTTERRAVKDAFGTVLLSGEDDNDESDYEVIQVHLSLFCTTAELLLFIDRN
jgi:hypothetical protein